MAHHMQEYPATPDEAFQQLADTPFLPSMSWWDACAEALPPLTVNEPCVIGLDAGVKDDNFGLVMVTRHPMRHDDVAVRHVQVWKPQAGRPVDIRGAGGPREVLYALIESWNVVQVCYDPSQLLDLAGDLARDGRVYVSEFGQGPERLQADRLLHDLILQRRIAHPGDAELTTHIGNADAKLDTDGRRMRIVKREQSLKIDLAVALSQAVKRCLDLAL
jgi:phage terminase large subunit-like protein